MLRMSTLPAWPSGLPTAAASPSAETPGISIATRRMYPAASSPLVLAGLAAGWLSSASPAAAQFICQQYGGTLVTAVAGIGAVACGTDSQATGLYSSAFGLQSRALGDYATAIGQAARAEGENAVALGSQTQSIGSNSTAVGTAAASGPREPLSRLEVEQPASNRPDARRHMLRRGFFIAATI